MSAYQTCGKAAKSVTRRTKGAAIWWQAILSAFLALGVWLVVWNRPPEVAASTIPLSATSIQGDDPSPPTQPVKLVFIHHSTGGYWLADNWGRLGITLRDNNYFVSATNYGWDTLGDYTDIGHWYYWFGGGRIRPEFNGVVLPALYANSSKNIGSFGDYSRLAADPGGENEIVMFKSCFPNSALRGSLSDPILPIGSNPLRGQDAGSSYHTVANAKGIYLDLLAYFQTRPDKLFVVIAAPPLSDPTYAANARAFNNWLVDSATGWLRDYPLTNVAVFDYYNVLTSNGGSPNINDLNQETGNHHRRWNNALQHKTDGGSNTLAYPTTDDHPSAAGDLKATAEFVPLLNIFYHRWKNGIMVLPSAVRDLHVTGAITSTNLLTATLGWTLPANSMTITLRYLDAPITEANWSTAPILTGTLPGAQTSYAATTPYSGALVYYALKSQNDTGWSALSNNAFWPQRHVYVPSLHR